MAQSALVKPKPVPKTAKEYTVVWEGTDRKGAKLKGSSIGPSHSRTT